jgi:hypothetical protein
MNGALQIKFRKSDLGYNRVRIDEENNLADAAGSAILRPRLPTLTTLLPRLFDSTHKSAFLK